ncbi:MAG TPA: hypothetical protein VN775_03320 [Opitutaceae bacterium]|nr:hypothetical protein [Opitutaceae bacterium]
MNDATTPQQEKTRSPGSCYALLAGCLVLAIVIIVLGVKVHRLNAQAAQVPDLQAQVTQAKSDTALAQAELDKAKAASTLVQSQLDKAKSQQSDLQSQLVQSKAASTQMQSQLDKAKAQSTDLQSQLDKAKAQSADLQAQLSQAAAGSSQLLSQLDQEKSRSMDLQSRLQKAESEIAQAQPLILKARQMPVTTSLEKSHGGPFDLASARGSFTLHIKNLHPQPVSVAITIAGPEKTRSQTNTIGVGATLNVDKLSAGEKVVIASEGYDPVALTVQ